MINNIEDGSAERLKILRKALNMTQIEFAEIINSSNGHVSDMEKGRKNITDSTMDLLKLKRNVNIDWLKTGKGEMFKDRSPSDEVGYYVTDLLDYSGEGNPFYDMIIEMMKTYIKLDEKSQTVIRDYFKKVSDGIHKETQED